MHHIHILGIRIDDVTQAEALTHAAALIEHGITHGCGHQVVTVNPEFVMEAQHNVAFREVLCAADLATPDGFGLLLAARWQGTPLRGRATGVALVQQLAALAAERGYRIFLLGAAPGVAEQAAAVLQRRHPALLIAGCFAGSPHARHAPFIQQIIAAAQPHILFVAYGHPAQDLWIARHQTVLKIPLALGVGGVFDYLAGHVPLAPRWMRQLGLEWLFRLMVQPHRWRRIITAVPLFSWAVLRAGKRGDRGHGLGVRC